jgi:hypothetical protein
VLDTAGARPEISSRRDVALSSVAKATTMSTARRTAENRVCGSVRGFDVGENMCSAE